MKNKNLTVSNFITASRIILLPFIVYFLVKGQNIIAFVIMFVALISDTIDGYVARKLHQESELGKTLDPLCDKISLAVIVLTLIIVKIMPIWAIIIIVRDFLILLGSFFMLKSKAAVLSSNLWGKITGFIFGVIICAYTLNLRTLGIIFLYISIPAIVATFTIYTARYVRAMKGA